jgi:hypothetical protein
LFSALTLTVFCGAADAATQTYEAESNVNTLTGSAGVYACTPCSGGKDVGYLGYSGQLTFNSVSAPAGGGLQVTVYYANGSTSNLTASASANGGTPVTVSFPPTGGWWTESSVSLTLPGNAGSNTVKIANASGWIADIDKISVTTTSSSTPPTGSGASSGSPATTVKLTTFGLAGQGGNDSTVVQNALNQTAANGTTLEIPAGTYNVNPLIFPNHASVVLDAGVIIQATTGYTSYQHLVNIDSVSNVSITGVQGSSIFRMNKAEYTSGEYRHCMDIEGSSSITISGIQCNSSGGDGLYIAGSNYVTVTNSGFDNNRRQGFSLISGSNITIDGDSFTNTSGTAPQDGIDIEPNNGSGLLSNIIIRNSTSSGNAGNGFEVSLWLTTPSMSPASITVSNFQTSNNAGAGYRLRNEHDGGSGGVGGFVLIQNSSSTSDGQYGAVTTFWDMPGPTAKFQNLTITNPNTGGSDYDGAAIGVVRGGGDCCSTGNVTFTGTSISGSHLSHYFTVENYSGGSVQNVCIGNWGTLSGVSASKGIYLGGAMDSVQTGTCP